jgi:hypothetical protein
MSLESTAIDDEHESPFYFDNKDLCEKWERFILDKSGEINGKYGAWSFILKAKVNSNNTWLIEVKKSTFSNGNLFLSSKKNNLQEILTFRTKIRKEGNSDFFIRKRKKLDLLCGFNPISESIKQYSCKGRPNEISKSLNEILTISTMDASLRDIEYKDSLLAIAFNYKNDWLEMAEKILSLSFDNKTELENP